MAVRTSTQAGDWSDTATWGGSAAPGDGDRAVIGHAVAVDANTTVGLSGPFTPNGHSSGIAPTVSASGGGGTTSLATGSYRVAYTNVDSNGVESSRSQTLAGVTFTNGVSSPRITLPALPTGVASRRIYLSDAGGAAETERLYATGVTGTTYDPTSASWMDGGDTYANATPIPDNSAITLNGSGTLTVDAGVKLTVRGDIKSNGCPITMAAGSWIESDASASVGTTNTYYQWFLGTGTGTNSNAILTVNGSSGSRCKITSNASGGVLRIGSWYQAGIGFLTNTGYGQVSYCDFERVGSSTLRGWNVQQFSGTSTVSFDHCTFDYCGVIYWNFSTPNSSFISITDNKFTNSQDATTGCLRLLAAVPTTGSRTVSRNSFDKTLLLTTSALVCDNNFFREAYTQSTSSLTWASFESNFVRRPASASGTQVTIAGEVLNCYWFWNGTSSNPHFITPVTGGQTSQTIDGCIFESTGAGGDGDGTYGLSGYTSIIRNNIILPDTDSPQEPSCTLHSMFGTANGADSSVIEHNTACVGQQSAVHFGESGDGAEGMIGSFKSNICWASTTGLNSPYKLGVITLSVGSSRIDACYAADADYNCGHNLSAGNAGKGYNQRFTGTPGANDVDVDPGFVDATRKLAAWAVHKGSVSGTVAGQITDALDMLAADPMLTETDLVPWVKAGFVPTNESLRDAGHDGVTIGAMEMAAPAGGAFAATTIYRHHFAGAAI